MEIVYIISIVILFLLCLSFLYIAIVNHKKNNFYKTWILNFKYIISDAYKKMQYLDKNGTFGAFESDDEVGYVFKQLHRIIEDLDTFVDVDIEENYNLEEISKQQNEANNNDINVNNIYKQI